MINANSINGPPGINTNVRTGTMQRTINNANGLGTGGTGFVMNANTA